MKEGLKACLFMVVVFSLVITVIIFLFGSQLLSLFLDPDLPHVLLGCFDQILPVKHDFPAGNSPRHLWQKAHKGQRQGGLTCTAVRSSWM